jgi:hypothetical protein
MNATIEEEIRTLAFQLAEIKSAGDAGKSSVQTHKNLQVTTEHMNSH